MPNLESVSALAAILPNQPSRDPTDRPFPRLKEISLVSWDEEPLDGVGRRSDGSIGVDSDLISTHLGGATAFANLSRLTLSFATIQFAHHLLTTVPLPNLTHLHLFGSYETRISYLPAMPMPPHVPPLSLQLVEEEGAHSLLVEIPIKLGMQLESLWLSLDGDPTQLRVPFPKEVLELCPRLEELSLGGEAGAVVRPLRVGHPRLRRLMLGHAAGHSGGKGGVKRVEEVVGVVETLCDLSPFDEREVPDWEEGSGVRRALFPNLESLGFWTLDFRGAKFGWAWKDEEQDDLKEATRTLRESGLGGKKGARLEDRFGQRV